MTPSSVVEHDTPYDLEPSVAEEEKRSQLPLALPEPLSPVAVNVIEAGHEGVGSFSWEHIFFEQHGKTNSLPGAIEANWSRIAVSKLSQEAFARLVELAAEADGWAGPNSVRMSGRSLQFFLEFWNFVRDGAVEPEFALASNGHLCAEWHSSWKKHLDLEFADGGRVFFGLFDGKSVLEGVEKGAELSRMFLARKNRPLKWKS